MGRKTFPEDVGERDSYILGRIKLGNLRVCKIPREYLHEKLCISIVRETDDPRMVASDLPCAVLTEAIVLECVKRHAASVLSFPVQLLTTEILQEALAQDGLLLGRLPQGKITRTLCKVAIEQNWRALQFVPPRLISKSMCMRAFRKDARALRHFPHAYRDDDLYWKAFNRDVMTLESLPLEYKTQKCCSHAVSVNPMAIQYVPSKVLTEEMCRTAVSGNGNAIRYLFSTRFISVELVSLAVTTSPEVFRKLPVRYKTPLLCLKAISEGYATIRDIPEYLTDGDGHILEPDLLESMYKEHFRSGLGKIDAK